MLSREEEICILKSHMYYVLDIPLLFQTFDWLNRKLDERCAKGGRKCETKHRSV